MESTWSEMIDSSVSYALPFTLAAGLAYMIKTTHKQGVFGFLGKFTHAG